MSSLISRRALLRRGAIAAPALILPCALAQVPGFSVSPLNVCPAPLGGNDGFCTLLIHPDGANGSTTFADVSNGSTPGRHTQTPTTTTVSTASFKFGTGSMLFASSVSVVTSDGSSNFAFGTGDFTIDFWMNIGTGAITQGAFDFQAGGSGNCPAMFLDGSNHLNYYFHGAPIITGSTAISTGVFNHILVARQGTNTKLFLNGVQEGSTMVDGTSLTVGASRPAIGNFGSALTAGLAAGLLNYFRISTGIARATANFTPPTFPYC